jgi:hypothetical protein
MGLASNPGTISYYLIAGPSNLRKYTARGPGVTEAAQVDLVQTYTVLPRDAYGNPTNGYAALVAAFQRGTSMFVRNSHGLAFNDHVVASTVAFNLATFDYTMQFLPAPSGFLHAEIMPTNVPILGSPFMQRVLPGPLSAKFSFIDGPGLRSASVGIQTIIVIHPRDANGNHLLDPDIETNFVVTITGENAPLGAIIGVGPLSQREGEVRRNT